MSEGIDTRVTPSLHPDNVKEVDGYDEQTAPYVSLAETAFSEAYIGIGQVHSAREKARTNPTWTEAQQIIQTQDFADKVFSRIARQMDGAMASLGKGIAALEAQLSAPVTSVAAQGVAVEIRAHVKALPNNKRLGFIQSAFAAGDAVTVSSVLGAPSYLSGLDAGMQGALLRQWHERNSPEVAQRLKTMKGARDLITNRGGLVFGELEKAVGAPPGKAKALREAKTAAEKAFVFREA